MVKIIVDSKETNSGIIRALKGMADVEVVVQSLDIGDYILGEGVGIERKEAVDFINSLIQDKRLFLQAENMVQAFPNATLLLEGDIFATRSMIQPEALIGALSHLRNGIGISVVPTKTAALTAMYLRRAAKHLQEGLGYDVPLRGSSPKHPGLACQFLVEGLPGIGPTAAMKLLAHFKTPRAVFTASADDMLRVPGLGPKTVEKIQALLEYRYEK